MHQQHIAILTKNHCTYSCHQHHFYPIVKESPHMPQKQLRFDEDTGVCKFTKCTQQYSLQKRADASAIIGSSIVSDQASNVQENTGMLLLNMDCFTSSCVVMMFESSSFCLFLLQTPYGYGLFLDIFIVFVPCVVVLLFCLLLRYQQQLYLYQLT